MQVPQRIAKAYALAKPGATRPAADPANGSPLGAARLVAGSVPVPADPALASNVGRASDGGAGQSTPTTYAMYTRAADRIEVATSIELGRHLDRRA
jgi:hypothetical protein